MSYPASKELVGQVDLIQQAWLRTETNWHYTEYSDLSLGFGKRSGYYWKIAAGARTHKDVKGPHILAIQLL
jgi:hypothetical protein